MKKLNIFILIFVVSLSFAQKVYSQETDKYAIFEQRCDSLITEINDFEPMSSSAKFDLHVINNVLPMTTDYLLMIRKTMIEAKKYNVELEFEFIIDGLIDELEELRKILE